MRGEHFDEIDGSAPELGSSPHARGALHPLIHLCMRLGIIPACAGSTILGCAQLGPYEDHPRMRGEHE